jgi:hypothetical protein
MTPYLTLTSSGSDAPAEGPARRPENTQYRPDGAYTEWPMQPFGRPVSLYGVQSCSDPSPNLRGGVGKSILSRRAPSMSFRLATTR